MIKGYFCPSTVFQVPTEACIIPPNWWTTSDVLTSEHIFYNDRDASCPVVRATSGSSQTMGSPVVGKNVRVWLSSSSRPAVPRMRPRRMPFPGSGTMSASDRNSSENGRPGRFLLPWAAATVVGQVVSRRSAKRRAAPTRRAFPSSGSTREPTGRGARRLRHGRPDEPRP